MYLIPSFRSFSLDSLGEGNHVRRPVDSYYLRPPPCELTGEPALAAADVQRPQAVNVSCGFEESWTMKFPPMVVSPVSTNLSQSWATPSQALRACLLGTFACPRFPQWTDTEGVFSFTFGEDMTSRVGCLSDKSAQAEPYRCVWGSLGTHWEGASSAHVPG